MLHCMILYFHKKSCVYILQNKLIFGYMDTKYSHSSGKQVKNIFIVQRKETFAIQMASSLSECKCKVIHEMHKLGLGLLKGQCMKLNEFNSS